ncbi:hypothetical protein CYY_007944 [Polysphondylium violaceum]|uniref:IPT/TIG domain-containing protein n=1 Tax=Polysphondylium violaceum TaxID=133409 RepID=A0A8J4PQ16_9MYCE|nr:hypothetical protein CYY_007944 [Polysphondylium violaceum]
MKKLSSILLFLILCTSISFIHSLDIKSQNVTRFTFVQDKMESIQFLYNSTSVTLTPESCSPDCIFEFKNYVKLWDAQTFIYKYTSAGKVLTKSSPFDKFGYIESLAPPKTSGSNQTFTAYFLQINPTLVKSFSAMINGQSYENEDLNLALVNAGDYTKYSITFPPGTGKIDITYDKKTMSINFAAPTIASHTMDADGKFSVVGDNFFNNASVIAITVDGKALVDVNGAIVSADFQKLVFSYPTNTTSSHKIEVTVDGIKSAAPYDLVIKPIVTGISSVPNKGGKVTVTGKYLNAVKEDGTPSVVKVTVGTTECAKPVNPQEGVFTHLVCDMPAGNDDNLDVFVEIDSIKSDAATVKFSYGFPTISSIKQIGNLFVVTGSCLGEVSTSEVIVNGAAGIKSSAISNDETQLNVTLPASTVNGKLQVKISATKTSIASIFKITPIIKSISKAATRGSTIVIVGEFLDPTKASLKDKDNQGFNCTGFTQTANATKGTSVSCYAPPGVGANHTVILSIDGMTAPGVFSYIPPKIDTVEQDFGYGIIKGSNFGRGVSDVKITFFNTQVVPATVDDQDYIKFHIPETANPGSISISVGSQPSNILNFPLKTVISGHDPISTAGGNLAIRGNFFNATGVTTIKVGEIECTEPTVSDDRTLLSCNLPAGSGKNSNIVVSNQGVEVSNPNQILFSYAPPSINSVSEINKDGGVLTIDGYSFNNPLSVSVGQFICENPAVENYNRITCNLAKITDEYENDTEYDLVVGVNGSSASSKVTVKGVPSDKDNRIRWLVPAIVIPCFFGLVTIVLVTLFLVKRHKNKQGGKK